MFFLQQEEIFFMHQNFLIQKKISSYTKEKYLQYINLLSFREKYLQYIIRILLLKKKKKKKKKIISFTNGKKYLQYIRILSFKNVFSPVRGNIFSP